MSRNAELFSHLDDRTNEMWRAFSVLLVFVLGTGVAAADPYEGRMCWRSLDPPTGEQDVGLGLLNPALAADGTSVWLSWNEHRPRLLQWSKGQWKEETVFKRGGVDQMHRLLVAADVAGPVALSLTDVDDNGTSAQQIARYINGTWQWLGERVISTTEAFTHTEERSVAFTRGGHPVLAWTEERHAKFAGLFVARWNGSRWMRLGARLNADRAPLSITVDGKGRIWLAWKDQGRPRVARWNGSRWLDIGSRDLRKRSNGYVSAISLKVDQQGHAWLLWRRGEPSVIELARWDGKRWTMVPTPLVRGATYGVVGSPAMILWRNTPLLAWSQRVKTENHHLFVAEWQSDRYRWIERLSNLHLVEGFSSVGDVRVAAGTKEAFFVSWDEVGKDNKRTRIIRAYLCAPNEKPAAPPKAIVERTTWSKTVDQAARRIAGKLDEASKARLLATKKSDLIRYHHGWGTGIRNKLGLWRGNDALLESCGRLSQGDVNPDSCSMTIIEAVWELVKDRKAQRGGRKVPF